MSNTGIDEIILKLRAVSERFSVHKTCGHEVDVALRTDGTLDGSHSCNGCGVVLIGSAVVTPAVSQDDYVRDVEFLLGQLGVSV